MSITAINAAPSIEPAPGLVNPARPNSGQADRFALFSDSWIELQAYAGAAAELPITKGGFEDKYGACAGSSTVTQCIDAMRRVQAASTEFGDPKSLRAALQKNPTLLATREPPKEIYVHTAWLGQRVVDTAGMIASGFDGVLADLSGLPPREQVINLKIYLFDQAFGPVPLSKQMSDDVGMLINKIGKFEQKTNEYNDQLKAFTKTSSSMIAAVNTAIGSLLQQRIADLESSRDDAYKAWRDFTVAAATSSVGCMLIGALLAPLTGVVSLLEAGPAAIALDVGLGAKAARCRARYNEYCGQIAGQGVELQKKQRLRNDLGDFDIQMQRVGPAMSGFLKNLQAVEGVWVRMNSDMLAIGNSIGEWNVATLPLLVKHRSRLAVEAWRSVNASARQFTAGSLIEYTSLAFGASMSETAPAKKAA